VFDFGAYLCITDAYVMTTMKYRSFDRMASPVSTDKAKPVVDADGASQRHVITNLRRVFPWLVV
jgi:hypothetical protein